MKINNIKQIWTVNSFERIYFGQEERNKKDEQKHVETPLHCLLEVTRDFCLHSNLHCLRRVVSGRKFGRAIWGSAFGVSVGLCFYMSILAWTRFKDSPTFISVETLNYPISNIAFPAVTLCNTNKVYKPNIKNVTKILKHNNITDLDIQNFLGNLSNLLNPPADSPSFPEIYKILHNSDYSVNDLMMELAQPCSELVQFCKWLGRDYECNKLFNRIKSKEGICCAFNYHALRDNLYAETPIMEKEVHVSGSGTDLSLVAFITMRPEEYISPVRPYPATMVMIHDPGVYPEMSVNSVIVQPNQDVIIKVDPTVVESTPNVKSLPPTQRKCSFGDEHYLRLSAEYTFENCVTECRVNKIYKLCGCVPFIYPSIGLLNGNSYEYCTLMDSSCLAKYQHLLNSLQPENTSTVFWGQEGEVVGMTCDCYPACSDRYYTVNVDKADIDPSMIKTFTKGIPNISKLTVCFKESTFLKYRRDAYMTWDALFAAFGGIFGLCIGGSIMSIAELVYYYTVNLLIKLRNIYSNKKMVTSQISKITRKPIRNEMNIKLFDRNSLSQKFNGMPHVYD